MCSLSSHRGILGMAVTAGVAVLGGSVTLAAPVVVPNHSFETAANWTGSQPSWNDGITVVSEATNNLKYAGSPPLPAPADGSNFAVITGPGTFSGTITSDGLGTLGSTGGSGAGSVYTLTVAAGWPLNEPGSGVPSVSLLLGSTVLATSPAAVMVQGAFTDLVAAYTVLGTESSTDQLSVRLNWANGGDGFRQTNFDNVRLDLNAVAAVPEPASFGLAAAAAGLGLARRRRN